MIVFISCPSLTIVHSFIITTSGKKSLIFLKIMYIIIEKIRYIVQLLDSATWNKSELDEICRFDRECVKMWHRKRISNKQMITE